MLKDQPDNPPPPPPPPPLPNSITPSEAWLTRKAPPFTRPDVLSHSQTTSPRTPKRISQSFLFTARKAMNDPNFPYNDLTKSLFSLSTSSFAKSTRNLSSPTKPPQQLRIGDGARRDGSASADEATLVEGSGRQTPRTVGTDFGEEDDFEVNVTDLSLPHIDEDRIEEDIPEDKAETEAEAEVDISSISGLLEPLEPDSKQEHDSEKEDETGLLNDEDDDNANNVSASLTQDEQVYVDDGSRLRLEHLTSYAEDASQLRCASLSPSRNQLASRSGFIPLLDDDSKDEEETSPSIDPSFAESSPPRHIIPTDDVKTTTDAIDTSYELKRAHEELTWLRDQLHISESVRIRLEAEAAKVNVQLAEMKTVKEAQAQMREMYQARLDEAAGVVEGVRRAGEEQIRALQDENARLRNENAGLARQVYEMQEKNAQATMSAQRELELESVIEALHHEKEDLYERLKAADVAKSTGEQSFRIFSRRLRTMQEQLNSAHEETETIRAELRRMQYEAPNAPISNGDGFFREKLEEVQSENAALRRMVEEMRHDTTTDAGHPTTPSSRISTAPPSRVPSAFTSRTHSPALSRAKSMSVTAWDQHPYTRQDSSPYATSPYATTATSPYATTSPTDHQRRSFAEKMRLYESDPHLPAVAAAPLTASSSPRMSPRMSASVLSADNPFANPGRRAEVAGGVYTAHKGRAGHTGEAWADGHSPGHGFSPAKGNTLAGGTPVTPTPPAAQNGYLQTRDELNRELAALAATKAALTSEMSKMPLTGGRTRRRKEEIEAQLDDVDKAIGGVKRRMRGHGMI